MTEVLMALVDGKMQPVAATMRQVGSELLIVKPAAGTDVAVFQRAGGPIELMLSNGDDTWRLALSAPIAGEAVTVKHIVDGTVEVRYAKG